MKKYLLLLFTLCSVFAYGQTVSGLATFDFGHPQTGLNPSVNPSKSSVQLISLYGEGGNQVAGDPKVFTDGDIQLEFSIRKEPKDVSTGVALTTFTNTVGADAGKVEYFLEIGSYAYATFKGKNGATINKISFQKGDYLGTLALNNGQSGIFDPSALQWEAHGNSSVNQVEFRNFGNISTTIHSITVEYSVPSVILEPTSYAPSSINTLRSFDGMTLTYSKALTIVKTDGITLTYGDAVQNPEVSVSGSTVSIKPSEALVHDGVVKVHIPAGCFKDDKGFVNKAVDYTYTVREARNTFNYISSDPKENTPLVALPSKIVLTFPDAGHGFSIGYVDSKKDIILADGKGFTCNVTASRNEADKTQLFLNIQDDMEMKDAGTYTISIPEGTVYNHRGKDESGAWIMDDTDGRYNSAITLTFIVNPNYVPDTSSDKMKAARELLKNVGVGYPTKDSEGYKALSDAVTAKASDELLDVALAKYYAETNVVMPTSGKYYKVAGVNTKEGKFYLCYKNGAVTLSTDTTNVAHFLATTTGNTVTLATADGKYLHVLTQSDGFDATTSANVTNSLTDASKLKFEKLESTDNDSLALGKFTMYGLMGKPKDDPNADEVSKYAYIQYPDGAIYNSPSDIYFAEDKSSAFIFEETTKPEDTPSVDPSQFVELSPVITPGKDAEGNVTLTIDFSKTGYTVESEKPDDYYLDSNNTATPVNHTQSSTEANIFTVTVGKVAKGDYTLVIKKGNLKCTKDNKTFYNDEIRLPFTVSDSPDNPDTPSEDTDFDECYDEASTILSPFTYYRDVDLNNFIIYHYDETTVNNGKEVKYDDMYPNPNKVVRLYNASYGNLIAEGHLERVDKTGMDSLGLYNAHALVVRLDKPIKSGDLADGGYTFVFEAASWGDSNFGLYLEHKLDDPTKCKVNPRKPLTYQVDNKKATGIYNVKSDNGREKVIYDITGRRVKSMSKPGLYIVNGKKVIKR